MTGEWEAFFKKIQHGECQLEPFLDDVVVVVDCRRRKVT